VELIVPRNPTWAYDELIVALDLYLRDGLLDDTDARVIELSEVLNALPIHTVRPDEERFRNPNGVAMKLGNFASHDPDYPGTGLDAGGRRDRQVWDRYADDPDTLARLAASIRAGAAATSDVAFPAAPEEAEDEVIEGKLLYRRHRVRERDASIVKRKKASVLKAHGQLACEVCGFNFATVYGELARTSSGATTRSRCRHLTRRRRRCLT
jgi:5-methylcytosine-specific restriction enzyme A